LLDISWVQTNFPDLSNIHIIGSGGQKFVYSCEHVYDGDVVFKLIHPMTSPATVQREILAVRQVQSSRVPKIFDSGYVDTPMGAFFWIREQQVHGETLRDAIARHPLSPALVLKLAVQILEALVAVEDANIVHRDVKPDNIMIDREGNFWLLDFGIARHLRMSSLTATAQFFGKFTLGYAPPEQLRNLKEQIDGRADLFALGVTLIEASTGINPFRHGASSDLEIIKRVETLRPPKLSLTLKYPDEFADFVDVMTKKRPDHRIPSVKEALIWARELEMRETEP